MNALDLARWRFGGTTIYHLLFHPGGELVDAAPGRLRGWISIGTKPAISGGLGRSGWCRGAPLARVLVPAQVAWNRLQGHRD
jgi:hypothetical protein